jgi:hypothetical protein
MVFFWLQFGHARFWAAFRVSHLFDGCRETGICTRLKLWAKSSYAKRLKTSANTFKAQPRYLPTEFFALPQRRRLANGSTRWRFNQDDKIDRFRERERP